MRAANGSMLALQALVRQATVAGALARVRSVVGGTAWLGQLAGPALLTTPATDHKSAVGQVSYQELLSPTCYVALFMY